MSIDVGLSLNLWPPCEERKQQSNDPTVGSIKKINK